MKHLLSKRTGQRAEENLLDIVKDSKKKTNYVRVSLHKLSETLNEVAKSNLDTHTIKTVLRLLLDNKLKHINESRVLDEFELEHLRNACRTRWMKTVRKFKIPLNDGKS